MNTLTKTTILSAAVVAIVGVAAVTADARPYKGLDFAALDTNSDGFVTMEELQAERDKRFDEMDANNDGALTGEELQAYRDTNGYGKDKMKRWGHGDMDSAERSKMIFEKMDADKNGSISQEELTAAMEKRQGRWGKHKGKFGKHRGKYGEHDGKRGPMQMLERMDANGDGKITKDEMGGQFIERIMEHLDTDNDQKISKAEAEKMRRMFKGKN